MMSLAGRWMRRVRPIAWTCRSLQQGRSVDCSASSSTPMMEGPGADSEEKHEPVSDIDPAVMVVGLKALDPEWPIREALALPVIPRLLGFREGADLSGAMED